MKTLKLSPHLAQAVLQGHQRSLWRINDTKNLSVNDEIELVNKAVPQDPTSWRAIGVAKIDSVIEKRLADITKEEHDENQEYDSIEHMYETLRKYYGDNLDPQTPIKILRFSFNAYASPRKLETVNVDAENITDVKVYADGGSRGNPGPSASGFAVLDMQDHVIKEGNLYIGVTTNNQAEYQALKLGLEEAKRMNARNVYAYMDSLLVVNQMKGIFRVKNKELLPVHQSIKDMLPGFKHVNFTHIPRELNKLADRLVNEALDSAEK
jgi:ribonuclease HI